MPTNHDLFLITHSDEAQPDQLSHIKVDSLGVPVELRRNVGVSYSGRRKVMKLAQPDGTRMRGAGFTILPNRPDPDASQMSCFLIDPRNLRDVNPWNATEWNESEDNEDHGLELEAAPEFETDCFETLLAGPGGRVYFIERKLGDNGNPALPTITELTPASLSAESELWVQLRNGLVAGSVAYAGHPTEPGRVIAALNVTSVLPRREAPNSEAAK